MAATILFSDDAPAQVPSHSEGGVLVTGSNILVITGGGLGVMGGRGGSVVDPAGPDPDEFLHFVAEGSALFTEFKAYSGTIGNVDDGEIDSFTLEGFDAHGASVGSFNYKGSGVFMPFDNLVARLGAGPLKAIRLTASGDQYTLNAIDVAFVPEPHLSGVLIGAGLLLHSRRRRI